VHLTGSTFSIFIQKMNLGNTLTYSDLCSKSTTGIDKRTDSSLERLWYFFSENLDSIKDCDISEFSTHVKNPQQLLCKN